jgi:hypothetical protein
MLFNGSTEMPHLTVPGHCKGCGMSNLDGQKSHENNARKRCLRIREKMGGGSQKWHRNSPVPENNHNGLEKSSCKSVEQEENHE